MKPDTDHHPFVTGIQATRNQAAAGAAFASATLVALAQVGAKEPSLQWAVITSSISVPLYFVLFMVCEMLIQVSRVRKMVVRPELVKRVTFLLAFPAGNCLVATLGCIVWYLYPPALFAGVGAAVLGIALHLWLALKLSKAQSFVQDA